MLNSLKLAAYTLATMEQPLLVLGVVLLQLLGA